MDIIELIQQSNIKPVSKFSQRFEVDDDTGAYLLSSIGCMKRFELTRDELENKSPETLTRYNRVQALYDTDESHIPVYEQEAMARSLKVYHLEA